MWGGGGGKTPVKDLPNSNYQLINQGRGGEKKETTQSLLLYFLGGGISRRKRLGMRSIIFFSVERWHVGGKGEYQGTDRQCPYSNRGWLSCFSRRIKKRGTARGRKSRGNVNPTPRERKGREASKGGKKRTRLILMVGFPFRLLILCREKEKPKKESKDRLAFHFL